MRLAISIPWYDNPFPVEESCGYCKYPSPHIHGWFKREVKDPKKDRWRVLVKRVKCPRCGKTFRAYPKGVDRSRQSKALKASSVILYISGISYDKVASFLEAYRCGISKSTVWRNVQSAGELAEHLHRKALKDRTFRIIGVDTTVIKVKNKKLFPLWVVCALTGKPIIVEVLDRETAEEICKVLKRLVTECGVQVMVQDGAGELRKVAEELGLEVQLCVAHARKSFMKRVLKIEKKIVEKLKKCKVGKKRRDLEDILKELKEFYKRVKVLGEGNNGLDEWAEELYKKYRYSRAPTRRGKKASLEYEMRRMYLDFWESIGFVESYLRHSGMGNTNNWTELQIGRCGKIRYKSMRNFKSKDSSRKVLLLATYLGAQEGKVDLKSLVK